MQIAILVMRTVYITVLIFPASSVFINHHQWSVTLFFKSGLGGCPFIARHLLSVWVIMNSLPEDILPLLCIVLHLPVAEISTLKGALFRNCEYSTFYYNQHRMKLTLFFYVILLKKHCNQNYSQSLLTNMDYSIHFSLMVDNHKLTLSLIFMKHTKDYNQNLPHPTSSESSPFGHSITKLHRLVNGRHVPSLHLCSDEVQFLPGLLFSLTGKEFSEQTIHGREL